MRVCSSTSPRTPTDEIGHPRPVRRQIPFRRLGFALAAVALVVAVIASLGAPDHAEATVPGEVLPTE